MAGGGNAARVSVAHAADAKATSVDLSGTWRLDPERSEMPGRRGAGGPGMRGGFRGGMGGRGGYGGRGGFGGPEGGGGWGGMGGEEGMRRPPREGRGGFRGDSLRGRPPGPPQTLRIHQHDGVVEFSDSTGALVREIDTRGGARSAPDTVRAGSAAMNVQIIHGEWKKDHLETMRTDRRGTKRTETFKLEDKGRRLVVETKIDIEGRGSRSFKMVYNKVTG